MGSARAAPPLALPIAPAIARGNQFFLKLQSFVGRTLATHPPRKWRVFF
jgi:hypothetical protein